MALKVHAELANSSLRASSVNHRGSKSYCEHLLIIISRPYNGVHLFNSSHPNSNRGRIQIEAILLRGGEPRGGEPWRGPRTADNVAARSTGPLPVPAEGGGGGGCVGAITEIAFLGLPPSERAIEPTWQYSNASLAALNCWYAKLWFNLPLTFCHIASGIHQCRRGTSRASSACMYPSKGRVDNGMLALAFETHNAASAREKRQDINLTLSGFAWVRTLSRIYTFTKEMWGYVASEFEVAM